MLQHHHANSEKPARIVVLGSRGFIGRHLTAHLKDEAVPTLAIGSDQLDLTATDAGDKLASMLRPDDAVVMLNAITPDKGRDIDSMMLNLAMARSVCATLAKQPVAQVVYVSSDAVYPFTAGLVNEDSAAAPIDLYGSMHRTREIMFESTVKTHLAIVRPTLVYGADDSHNSYGPNRFRRQAAKDGKITLGGAGEETRDHIAVQDLVRLISLILSHRSSGKLNLATGHSVSFQELARLVAAQFGRPIEITFTTRGTAITHRTFDVTATRKAFPTFAFTPLHDGLAAAHAAMLAAEK
jgi:nucleoside-diphosphate-sugar epimerase